MWCRIYLTVGCPSISSIEILPLAAAWAQAADIDRAAPRITGCWLIAAGVQAAIAASVMLKAEIRGSTQTCSAWNHHSLLYILIIHIKREQLITKRFHNQYWYPPVIIEGRITHPSHPLPRTDVDAALYSGCPCACPKIRFLYIHCFLSICAAARWCTKKHTQVECWAKRPCPPTHTLYAQFSAQDLYTNGTFHTNYLLPTVLLPTVLRRHRSVFLSC